MDRDGVDRTTATLARRGAPATLPLLAVAALASCGPGVARQRPPLDPQPVVRPTVFGGLAQHRAAPGYAERFAGDYYQLGPAELVLADGRRYHLDAGTPVHTRCLRTTDYPSPAPGEQVLAPPCLVALVVRDGRVATVRAYGGRSATDANATGRLVGWDASWLWLESGEAFPLRGTPTVECPTGPRTLRGLRDARLLAGLSLDLADGHVRKVSCLGAALAAGGAGSAGSRTTSGS